MPKHYDSWRYCDLQISHGKPIGEQTNEFNCGRLDSYFYSMGESKVFERNINFQTCNLNLNLHTAMQASRSRSRSMPMPSQPTSMITLHTIEEELTRKHQVELWRRWGEASQLVCPAGASSSSGG